MRKVWKVTGTVARRATPEGRSGMAHHAEVLIAAEGVQAVKDISEAALVVTWPYGSGPLEVHDAAIEPYFAPNGEQMEVLVP